MNKLTNKEMIETIKGNYPPSNYTMLRETLDYCMVLLERESNGIYISTDKVKDLLNYFELIECNFIDRQNGSYYLENDYGQCVDVISVYEDIKNKHSELIKALGENKNE